MNPSTSLGTRSNVGMAKPSPAVRQTGNIWHLLVIRGVCRRSLPSACAHVKYRCRCRDKEANHQIVHRCRFGKATGAPDEPRDPGPQVDVFALDFLRVLLAYVMLLWGDVPLIRAPPIGVKAGDAKRFQ